jgi:hypothetical protein
VKHEADVIFDNSQRLFREAQDAVAETRARIEELQEARQEVIRLAPVVWLYPRRFARAWGAMQTAAARMGQAEESMEGAVERYGNVAAAYVGAATARMMEG